eukprot:gene11717-34444_t
MRRRHAETRGANRRPIGYWQEFNEWYRGQLQSGERPPVEVVANWYDECSCRVWPITDERPTWKETRLHAKCLRSTDEVKTYFQRSTVGKGDDAFIWFVHKHLSAVSSHPQLRNQEADPHASGSSFGGHGSDPSRIHDRDAADGAPLASLVSLHNAKFAHLSSEGQDPTTRRPSSAADPLRTFSLPGPPFSPLANATNLMQSSFSPPIGPPKTLTITTGMNQATIAAFDQIRKANPFSGSGLERSEQHHGSGSLRTSSLFAGSSDRTAPGSLRSSSMFAVGNSPKANDKLRSKSMFATRSEYPLEMDTDEVEVGRSFNFATPPMFQGFSGLDGHAGMPALPERGSLRIPSLQPGEQLHKDAEESPFSGFLSSRGHPPAGELSVRGRLDSMPSTQPYGSPRNPPGRSWLVESGTTPLPEAGNVFPASADWSGFGVTSSGHVRPDGGGERILPNLETLLAIKHDENQNPLQNSLGEVPSWLPRDTMDSAQLSDLPSWVPTVDMLEGGKEQEGEEDAGITRSANPLLFSPGENHNHALMSAFPQKFENRSQPLGPLSGHSEGPDFPSLIRKKPGPTQQAPRRPRLYYEHIFKHQEGLLTQSPGGSGAGMYPLPQTRSATVQTADHNEQLPSPRGSLPATWGGAVVTTCQPGTKNTPKLINQSPFLAMTIAPSHGNQSGAQGRSSLRPHPSQAQTFGEQRSWSMQNPASAPGLHAMWEEAEEPAFMHRAGSCPGDPNKRAVDPAGYQDADMVIDTPCAFFTAGYEDTDMAVDTPTAVDQRETSDGSVAKQPVAVGGSEGSEQLDEHSAPQASNYQAAASVGVEMGWRQSQSFDWIPSMEEGSDPIPNLDMLGSLLPSWRSSLEAPPSVDREMEEGDDPPDEEVIAYGQQHRSLMDIQTDHSERSLNPSYPAAELNPSGEAQQAHPHAAAFISAGQTGHGSQHLPHQHIPNSSVHAGLGSQHLPEQRSPDSSIHTIQGRFGSQCLPEQRVPDRSEQGGIGRYGSQHLPQQRVPDSSVHAEQGRYGSQCLPEQRSPGSSGQGGLGRYGSQHLPQQRVPDSSVHAEQGRYGSQCLPEQRSPGSSGQGGLGRYGSQHLPQQRVPDSSVHAIQGRYGSQHLPQQRSPDSSVHAEQGRFGSQHLPEQRSPGSSGQGGLGRYGSQHSLEQRVPDSSIHAEQGRYGSQCLPEQRSPGSSGQGGLGRYGSQHLPQQRVPDSSVHAEQGRYGSQHLPEQRSPGSSGQGGLGSHYFSQQRVPDSSGNSAAPFHRMSAPGLVLDNDPASQNAGAGGMFHNQLSAESMGKIALTQNGPRSAGSEGAHGRFVPLPAHLRSTQPGPPICSMSCLLPPVSSCLKPGVKKDPEQ